MKVIKRFAVVLLSLVISFALTTPTFAIDLLELQDASSTAVPEEQFEKEIEREASSTIVIDANTGVLLEKQDDGSFSGTFEIPDASVTATPTVGTKFTASLHGNVAGVANKYTLIISWAGNAEIGYMRADDISVRSTSVLHPLEYYWCEDYYVTCGGATAGSRSAGVFNIPEDVTKVWVETTGFQAYVLNSSLWYATEIMGAVTLE